ELGVFVVSAEARPETAQGALTAIWDQLRRARGGEISEAELERAKRIYEARWIRQLEDMEGQANYLASWQALGDWMLGDRYLDSIMRASSADLAAAAQRWLSPDDASVL